MSELSAKHEALTILQVLTSEKDPRTLTSPRSDLAGSQDILAGKYRELAALLANQLVERKMVTRLQRVDLIAKQATHAASRRKQDYRDSLVKPVRRSQRKTGNKLRRNDIPQDGVTPGDAGKKNETDFDSVKPQHSLIRGKKVSFSDAGHVSCTDDDCSSSTSDTEIIRRILRSPRRVTTEVKHGTSRSAERGICSPTGKKQMSRRKLHVLEVKKSVEGTPRKTSDGSKRDTSESPRAKKELQPTDNKLSSSSNPDVLSWLKDKNKLIRKHRRSERKKEHQEKLAEQKAAEEKIRRLAESEDKVSLWMKYKKEESIMKWKAERKVRRKMKLREALSPRTLVRGPNERPSSGLKAPALSGGQNKSMEDSKNKPIKSPKIVPHTSDRGAPHQCHLEEGRPPHVRNVAANRLHAEEKRHRREAEKRQKKLLKEAQTVTDTKKTFAQPSVSASAKEDSQTKSDIGSKVNASGDNRRNRPSSNPFKGMTYDEWIRQKQADRQKQAKEAKKQEVGDPELDDLIPVQARRRIEQIKTRATRVDSGLRRSRDQLDHKKEKPRPPNGVRPYTWETSTAPTEKPKQTTKSNPPAKSRNSDKEENFSGGAKQNIASSMPDVINFERPDSQRCEGNKNASCQSPKASQSEESKDTHTGQSEANADKMKQCSANENAGTPEQRPDEQSDPLETDLIFMTQPAM